MRRLRSLLFVPGDKPAWVEKAWRANPDGIIIDLEDAVPLKDKEESRKIVGNIIKSADPESYYCVRVNSLSSGITLKDLEMIVHPNLDAVILPKVYRSEDLARVSDWIASLEHQHGMPEASISLPLLLETAPGMRHAYDIATANSRVDTILMSAGPGGDAQRAIGYRWSKQGTETLYLRSKIVLDARAARATPMINSWYDIKDLQGLSRDAMLNRSLGYAGMAVIHPGHVEIINEIFTPSRDELKFYQGLIEAFEQAEHKGSATAVYEGDMVDYAMAETARQIIEDARRFGIEI